MTLCMVVKNEEVFLTKCLQSVKGLVEEIVVVDTGSTDRTVEIANRFGARVIVEPWENDFSKPLNRALREASGEWILRLDGDEELYPEDRGKVRSLLNKETAAYVVQIVNLMNERNVEEEEVSSFVRLFRNNPNYRFEGMIHEQIVPSIIRDNPQAVIQYVPIRIRHYGYLKEVSNSKNKDDRNLELTLQALRQEPDNAYMHYYLGMEYRRRQHRVAAIQAFDDALKSIDPALPWVSRCVQSYAVTLFELGRWSEGKAILEKGMNWYKDYTDLVYLRGVVHLEQGEYVDAVADFAKCIAMGDPPGMKYVVTRGIGGYKAYLGLAQVYEKMGKDQDAIENYEKSYKLLPRNIQTLYSLSTLLVKHQAIPLMQRHLETVMPFPDSEKYPVLADIFLSLKQYAAAEKYLRELLNADKSQQYRYLLGGCRRKLGDYAEAVSLLAGVRPESPTYMEAQIQLCAARRYMNESEQVEAILARWNENESFYDRLSHLLLEDAVDILEEGIRLLPDASILVREKERLEEVVRNAAP